MKKAYKLLFLLFLCFVIVFMNISMVCAYEKSITQQPEIEIPDNLFFEIQQVCKGHKTFFQADANEKGDFVVLGTDVNYNKDVKSNIFRNFVDIYDSNGNLICELSFRKCICAVRMSENTVFIIFQNNVLTFDILSKDTHFYETANLNLWVNEGKNILRTSEFTSGNARYKMVTSLFTKGEYNKLTKYSENRNEVILKYKIDAGNLIKQIAIYIILIFACVIVFIRRIRRYKKQVTNKNKKQFSIDGFYLNG